MRQKNEKKQGALYLSVLTSVQQGAQSLRETASGDGQRVMWTCMAAFLSGKIGDDTDSG